MKIIERIDREPSNSPGPRPAARTLALLAGSLFVASFAAGVITAGPISQVLFVVSFEILLWTAMIAVAFGMDRRQRLNYLRGR